MLNLFHSQQPQGPKFVLHGSGEKLLCTFGQDLSLVFRSVKHRMAAKTNMVLNHFREFALDPNACGVVNKALLSSSQWPKAYPHDHALCPGSDSWSSSAEDDAGNSDCQRSAHIPRNGADAEGLRASDE